MTTHSGRPANEPAEFKGTQRTGFTAARPGWKGKRPSRTSIGSGRGWMRSRPVQRQPMTGRANDPCRGQGSDSNQNIEYFPQGGTKWQR